MNLVIWSLLLFSIILNSFAQIFLKIGMNYIGKFSFIFHNFWDILYKIATNYLIILGIFCYFISIIVWLMVLSRLPVGIAYPMLSISYIITVVASYFLLEEIITLTKIIGIFVIILGVYLIVQSQ